MKYLAYRDFFWILPLSFSSGAVLSFLQAGNRFIGWLGFSFLFLHTMSLLTLSARWAGGASTSFNPTNTGLTSLSAKSLAWMVTLAFVLRLAGGVATYLILPMDGYNDADDKAGFIYTDAHRRDTQAWELASSDKSIITAFTDKFTYDQYGGLLAFSALIYRYLSPDVHRPLMLVLVSAFTATLGLPFLWKSVSRLWGKRIALISCWLFVLFPESILLGGEAMREPYLMTFSAIVLWGFVIFLNSVPAQSQAPLRQGFDNASTSSARRLNPAAQGNALDSRTKSFLWLGLGILGMLLVSPVVALGTIVLFAGWIYFTSERGRISWWVVAILLLVFIAGLFVLSAALNRQGNLGEGTPVGIIGAFWREAVKWDVYQLERGSGWVQKLFNHMPDWLQLPFVMVYGIFQPVLPAAFVEPTTLTWRIIGILRAVGWWILLPVLVFSIVAAACEGRRPEPVEGSDTKRKLWMWITLFVWTWILLAALRGGGDQWDNPRYRTILFTWEAIAAGYAFVRCQEMKSSWLLRIVVMEVLFLLFFSQWYASRYYHFGPQMDFGQMIAFILGCWVLVFFGGWILDHRARA